MSEIARLLVERSGGVCELCGGAAGLHVLAVDGGEEAERALWACEVCAPQVSGDAPLDSKHWSCLQGAIWSAYPAVQVTSWRLLHRLKEEAWAGELLEQAYLEEEVLAWAREGVEQEAAPGEAGAKTVDANGNELFEGDAVTLVRNLDVKGAQFTAKQGTLVKNIRLTDDPRHVEGKVNGMVIVLKTMYLKRA
jgi:protein PhnA